LQVFLWFVVLTDPDVVSPSEINVLDALLNGGRTLSLKVTPLSLLQLSSVCRSFAVCHTWKQSSEECILCL